MLRVLTRTVSSWLCVVACLSTLWADEAAEFFEARVRPVLAETCWQCHATELQQGGLRLDSRDAVLAGGSRGPAIVPGDPTASLLLRALRHQGLEMPPGGRLEPSEIRDFERWIKDGARWPDTPPVARAADAPVERAQNHWAFRAVRKPGVPQVQDSAWLANDVDAFVLSRLESEGLRPAAPASRRSLIRRLAFDLTGLPPRPEVVEAFVNSESASAYSDLVDELLASDRFGEHWARHWMDWVRYCESHGSQGDFELPMAWRYRDYLIRAFNSDVPYDQLLREYLAGDLLPRPRINEVDGLNESKLGPANLRMVEYGYVPVDALDDQVKVVDNQIDVLTKAFQGITVSCARCHDHKFDPITQADFYALYGIFASSRPGMVVVDSPERLSDGRERLTELRRQIQSGIAANWAKRGEYVSALLARADEELAAGKDGDEPGDADSGPQIEALVQRLASDDLPADDPLRVWLELRQPSEQGMAERWIELRREWQSKARETSEFNRETFEQAWDLSDPTDAQAWFPEGPGVPTLPSAEGAFRVEATGDRVITGVLPAGLHSGLDTRKDGGVLGSPRFRVSSDYISLRVSGSNFASVRLVVENYPIGDGGIFPAKNLTDGRPGWVRFDTAYRKGQMAHIELQTLDDRSRPFRSSGRDPERKAAVDGRSSFGIAKVVFHDAEEIPREMPEGLLHLLGTEAPQALRELEERIGELAQDAARAWASGGMNRRQRAFLDALVRSGLLPLTLDELPDLRALVDEYRIAEGAVPVPRRAPGVLPGTSFNQPLLVRGDHNTPGNEVKRRYLEMLEGAPFQVHDSGRLELAEQIASAENPLTARVLVNRLWHYLFGQGIVSTVDNFGATAELPSHPEMLDFLASRFVEGGWSIKSMLRLLVLSRTYRMSTAASDESRLHDPENRLLQHQNVRRLPAESIRDAILETSGDLDRTMYGPSVNVYYVGKTEGGGTKGPLDGERRRSVYQAVRRNAQNPFLQVFDSPKPSTTRGRRDSTNIPAQALAMLNDPFVIGQAERWADRTLADGAISPEHRARRMFRRALGRSPDPLEVDLLMTSLGEFANERDLGTAKWLGDRDLWKDFAQSLFNLKQFIYLR